MSTAAALPFPALVTAVCAAFALAWQWIDLRDEPDVGSAPMPKADAAGVEMGDRRS